MTKRKAKKHAPARKGKAVLDSLRTPAVRRSFVASLPPEHRAYADFLIDGLLMPLSGPLKASPSSLLRPEAIVDPSRLFATGIFKASVFGVLIAFAGCLRGVQCGNNASAVGDAATSAVVTGIVMIIVTDAMFTVLFDILGI